MPYAKIFGFAVSIVLWNCVTFGEETEIHRIDPPSLEYRLPETMAVHVVNEKNVPLHWTPVTLSITLAPEDGERSQGITFRSSTNEHGDALLKFDPSLSAKQQASHGNHQSKCFLLVFRMHPYSKGEITLEILDR